MEPVISVLIPTYNRSKSLIRAVNSVLLQSYKNIEIVISDNSEGNESYNELVKIDFKNRKFVYNRNLINIGPVLNWKKALDLSTGQFCIILPDDDFLINPFYFEDALTILIKEKVKLVFTACILGGNSKRSIVVDRNCSKLIPGIDFIKGFWISHYIPTIANIFDKSYFLSFDYFYDNDILYSDIEFWLKSLATSDIYFYNIPSVYYTFHNNNIVTTMNLDSLIINSKFISTVTDYYKIQGLDIEYYSFKSSLLLRYIYFTFSIYSFFSFKYIFQIFKVNNHSVFHLGFFETISFLVRISKKIIFLRWKPL